MTIWTEQYLDKWQERADEKFGNGSICRAGRKMV